MARYSLPVCGDKTGACKGFGQTTSRSIRASVKSAFSVRNGQRFPWTMRTTVVEIGRTSIGGGAMIEYRSRVIDRDGKLSLLVLSIHNSDRAAIQAATKLCRPNETLSVWRDDLCIY